MPQAQELPVAWLVSALALAAIATFLFSLQIRAKRRKRREDRATAEESPVVSIQIRAADVIRRALIERFGAAYVARTTEELREDDSLAEQLGAETRRGIVALLSAADIEKFGGKTDANVDRAALDQCLNSLLAAIHAGARSRRIGRWSEPMSGPTRRETTAIPSETKA